MKLGDVVQISIGVSDLAESVLFYEKLGFSQIAANQEPWPWAQFSDGRNLILLNQDGNQYLGLNYFSTNVAEKVAEIEGAGVSFLTKQQQNGRIQTAIFADQNGLIVGLINHEAAEMPHPTGFPLCHCGKFGELAVAVNDFGAPAAFWQQFGFEPNHTSNEPYPWGIFSDGRMVLGFHETTEFGQNSPALTYFAPDMPQRIERVRKAGIIFASEVADKAGVVREVILNGPGGEAIFMFEGEV
jgi:catechol 2,3-dioxygenase-like lactoylglutathione lyase family enzyme